MKNITKEYQKGYIDGFNRCINMIEKLQLTLVYKDIKESINDKK